MAKSLALEHLRDTIRIWHYSGRTEQIYVQWVRRFSFFQYKS